MRLLLKKNNVMAGQILSNIQASEQYISYIFIFSSTKCIVRLLGWCNLQSNIQQQQNKVLYAEQSVRLKNELFNAVRRRQ